MLYHDDALIDCRVKQDLHATATRATRFSHVTKSPVDRRGRLTLYWDRYLTMVTQVTLNAL